MAVSFENSQTFAVGRGPVAVTSADLNGDGHADLVSASFRDNAISVLLGNGDGTFQVQKTLAVGPFPRKVTGVDLNGDGRIDLVSTNSGDGTVSILVGNGDGTFQAQQTLAVGSDPRAVTSADLNGDGHTDLLGGNYGDYGDSSVSVLIGNGNGTFEQASGDRISLGGQTYTLSRAQNGDAVLLLSGGGSVELTGIKAEQVNTGFFG